jgi:hypothetical protein
MNLILKLGKKSIGLLLFVICSIAIYNKVLVNENWAQYGNRMQAQLSAVPISQWLVLLLLMGCNFFIESIKWKRVVANSNPIKISKAIQSILVGQAFAFFTPNRIGEFAGRTMFLDKGNKLIGAAQMGWASYAQLLATISIGALSLAINFHLYAPVNNLWLFWVKMASPLIGIMALFLFFYQHEWKGRLSFINRVQIETPVKLDLLWLSLIRYFVFMMQYLWVAYILKIDIAALDLLSSISILFLCLSILPTISLTELVIRGQLLLMLLAPFYGDKMMIISLSSIIWGVNFLVPSIIGTFLLLGYRFNR